jgi:hypothetical protein
MKEDMAKYSKLLGLEEPVSPYTGRKYDEGMITIDKSNDVSTSSTIELDAWEDDGGYHGYLADFGPNQDIEEKEDIFWPIW